MNYLLHHIQSNTFQEQQPDLFPVNTLSHKINRILRQEEFKNSHLEEYDSLTNREVEIISLVANGLLNPQIAEKLFISRHTVEQHRKNINRKLNIRSINDLFQYALAFDLL